MKLNKKMQGFAVGILLLCAAGHSCALALGKARGAVILGQPLSLNIALQYGADEESSDWCFDADVYYGEVRQEGSRVTALPVRSESGAFTGVRVIAAAPVDEPVVTVYLRSSCGLKTSRKYVLLSDLVSDLLPTTSVEADSGRAKPVVVPSAIPLASLGMGRQSTDSALSNQKSVVRKPQKAEARIPKQIPFSLQAPARSGSRLSVSILDLTELKDPNLKWSSDLASVPAEDVQKREAARALWRSLNTSSSDVLRDDTQQLAISSDIKSLKDLANSNQQELKELGLRLTQAESIC